MKLTYTEAISTILEPTEIGYTLRSLDRLWTVCFWDEWSEDQMRHNRIYFAEKHTSYELWDKEFVWTSRWEAEAFRQEVQEQYDARPDDGRPRPKLFVYNLGDDRRWERAYFGEVDRKFLTRGKFRGSDAAMAEQVRQFNLAAKRGL